MSAGVMVPFNPETALGDAEVVAYLRGRPDFFTDHLELLEILEIPHPSGEAVSLVARQMDVLREKNRRLDDQLSELVQIARDNDALHQRIHQLTLTLLAARGLEEALAGLEEGLTRYFQTDFVAVRIVEPPVALSVMDRALLPEDGGRQLIAEVLESGQPRCGRPAPGVTAELFGDQALEVASQALVPLRHARLRGVLAIGSRDPDRFQPGMGSLFLAQLGEILSARLAALIGP